jgi:hypothetical protein
VPCEVLEVYIEVLGEFQKDRNGEVPLPVLIVRERGLRYADRRGQRCLRQLAPHAPGPDPAAKRASLGKWIVCHGDCAGALLFSLGSNTSPLVR